MLPSNDIALRLEQLLQDPTQRERWKTEPLAILGEVGFPLDDIPDENLKQFSEYLSSIELFGWPTSCTWCGTWVFATLLGAESALVIALIAACILLIGGAEGADEAAIAAAVELDEAGVISVSTSLADLEVTGFDIADPLFSLPGEALARACVQAFKMLSVSMEANKLFSFNVGAIIVQFDRYFTNQICVERGDC